MKPTSRTRDRPPPSSRNRFPASDSHPNPSISPRRTSGSGPAPNQKLSWGTPFRPPPPHGLPSPPNTNTNSSDGSLDNFSRYPRSLPYRNRVGLLTRTQSTQPPNSDKASRPGLSPRSNLFNARPPRSAALRQLGSLANLKTEPYSPHTPSPSPIPRASAESSRSSVRRSMDPLAHDPRRLSGSRPPSAFSQPASLSRNSSRRTSPLKRVASAWKPQGTPPPKDIPRHSLDITPTRTVVPPALVTDVPLLKRTSTTNLAQFQSPASTSSISFQKSHVRSNPIGSASSLDIKSSKVRLRERPKEVNEAKIEEPPAGSRSKKLISMKEKNERILANINATLSPPPSPAKAVQPPSSEPPLPPPPPSSDSSSASSSTSSDTDADSRAFSAVISSSVHRSELLEPSPVQLAASHTLSVPGQSGLIPFAQGLSPSPRKISSSSTSNANPVKPPKLREDDGRDEDLRLGSVRGKRADQRPSLNCFGLDEEEKVGQAAKAFAGEDGRQDEDQTFTYKTEKNDREQSGSMKRITARTDGQMSNPQCSTGPKRDRQQSSRGSGHPGTDSHSHPLPPSDDSPPSSAQIPDWPDDGDEQAEGGRRDGIRHSSESMSAQTSSSETIGKGMTDSHSSFTVSSQHRFYGHPEHESPDDEAYDEGRRLVGSLRLPRTVEAEEEDMLTPVKKARSSLLRHASSVDDVAGSQHDHPRLALASGPAHLARGLSRGIRRGEDRLATHHPSSSSQDLSLGSSAMRRPDHHSPPSQQPSSSSSPLAPAASVHGQGHSPDPGARSRRASLAAHPAGVHQPLATPPHPQLLYQPTDEWDERGARRSSIFPSTTAHHHHPSPRMHDSPPQSHLAHSRRPRPSLPQHFIQPTRTDNTYRSPVLSTPARTPERSVRASPQHSQTFYPSPTVPARLNRRSILGSDSLRGESAMSLYEPASVGLDRSSRALSSFRSKHSSLTTTDDYGHLERSQSVAGGVYDPRNLTTGRLGLSRRAPGSDEDGRESVGTSQRHSKTGSGSDRRWASHTSEAQPRSSTAQRERERTVRRSGGTRTSHLVRLSHDSTSRNGALADQQSTSSGGSSSRQHYLPTKPPRPVSRHLPNPFRPDSAALSPTPEVDHHKLLLGALEALEASEEEDELVNLVSNVVKQTCRINAALQTLVETGIGAQVELELAEDQERIGLLESERAETERAHAALARVSNDQIRDLTESLICLQNRLRTRQRRADISGRQSVAEQQRRGDVGGPGFARESMVESATTRSLSRASGHYSRSASPAKLSRAFTGISPLTRIIGLDEEDSPLDRVSKRTGPTERRVGTGALLGRSATITFDEGRHSSLGVAFQQRLKSANRLSGSSQTTTRRRRVEGMVDEFGSYRASLDGPSLRTSGLPEGVRSSQSMMVFPNAPPKRLTTSLVTELNAHSHLGRRASEEEEVDQDRGRGSMSSMSQILDRAQSMLARRNTSTNMRARNQSDASIEALRNALGAGRASQSSTNLRRFEGEEEEEEEIDEENRTPMKHDHRRLEEEGSRRRRKMSTLSGASAALEKLSGFGGGVRSWASGNASGPRNATGSGSGLGLGVTSGKVGQPRVRGNEELEVEDLAGTGSSGRRRTGGSIQQLLKMKRASIIRN